MKKLLISLPLTILLLCLFITGAHALTMDYIGGLDTSGQGYSIWWYTGLQPRIGGTADVGATVDVAVGDQSGLVPTDADGGWWWDPPTAFSAGDYATTITDGTDTISFTLTLGSSVPGATQAATGSGVPATGTWVPTVVLGLIAVGIMAMGAWRMVFILSRS